MENTISISDACEPSVVKQHKHDTVTKGLFAVEDLEDSLTDFSEERIVELIYEIQLLLPVKIRYEKKQIKEFINDPESFYFFLKKDSEIVGYLLATPQNDAVKELEFDDPLMKKDDFCYYIDQIVVKPDERKGLSAMLLVDALIRRINHLGIFKISSHILATDNLHVFIARKFRKTLIERRFVTLAMHDNEPFEYMVALC